MYAAPMTNAQNSWPRGYVGPLFRCHKLVHAARIVDFDYTTDAEQVVLRFDGAPSITVPLTEVRGIEAGGYLVQYADGYRSFSPAKAFEEGYTRIGVDPDQTNPGGDLVHPAPHPVACAGCMQILPDSTVSRCPHCGVELSRYTLVSEEQLKQIQSAAQPSVPETLERVPIAPALGAKVQINMLALTPAEARDVITQLQPIANRGA